MTYYPANTGNEAIVYTPEDSYLEDPYSIHWMVDFHSQDYENPFYVGQVVELNADASMVPVTNPVVIIRP